MELYTRVADLKLAIDDYALERREHVTPSWTRVTTTIVMRGAGLEGRGEDVTYEVPEHDVLAAARPIDLSAVGTFDEASGTLAELGTGYRRWAFESAALDLALRQGGQTLGGALGLSYRPVRFCMSTRQDARPWLEAAPGLEFKLDPEPTWDDAYLDWLAASGRVRVLDLKAHYPVEVVGVEPDERRYVACRDRFDDDTTIEDAWFADGWLDLFRGHEHRLAFDAIIHSVADIEALPFLPRRMNIKPSRFGPVSNLFATIEFCKAHRIALYGGGQSELGVGRDHVQALASLFYAAAANDVAPREYNTGDARRLPQSPLAAPEPATGIA
ncbi:MAG: hypothetical protein QOE98_353 [Gaiellaceae bacterium]|nr:hypothetical protein [Gaiellaceae bacterium]